MESAGILIADRRSELRGCARELSGGRLRPARSARVSGAAHPGCAAERQRLAGRVGVLDAAVVAADAFPIGLHDIDEVVDLGALAAMQEMAIDRDVDAAVDVAVGGAVRDIEVVAEGALSGDGDVARLDIGGATAAVVGVGAVEVDDPAPVWRDSEADRRALRAYPVWRIVVIDAAAAGEGGVAG